MKTIKFHYYKSKTIGGLLIRARLHSIFNHVVIEFEDCTIHSTLIGGCEYIELEEYGEPTYTSEITVSNKNYKEALDYARSLVGKSYDYMAIIGFLFIKKLHNGDGIFCSEIGYGIFERATKTTLNIFTLIAPGQLRLITDTYSLKT